MAILYWTELQLHLSDGIKSLASSFSKYHLRLIRLISRAIYEKRKIKNVKTVKTLINKLKWDYWFTMWRLPIFLCCTAATRVQSLHKIKAQIWTKTRSGRWRIEPWRNHWKWKETRPCSAKASTTISFAGQNVFSNLSKLKPLSNLTSSEV